MSGQYRFRYIGLFYLRHKKRVARFMRRTPYRKVPCCIKPCRPGCEADHPAAILRSLAQTVFPGPPVSTKGVERIAPPTFALCSSSHESSAAPPEAFPQTDRRSILRILVPYGAAHRIFGYGHAEQSHVQNIRFCGVGHRKNALCSGTLQEHNSLSNACLPLLFSLPRLRRALRLPRPLFW